MKTLFLIDDNISNKISFYHLACFLVALPFDLFYSQLVIISFAIHTIIHLQENRLHLLLNKIILIPIAVYIIGLIAICYSTDKTEGLNIAGRQTAIFFIPVLLALNQLNLNKYKFQLLKIFAFTCTIVTVYLYADAIHTLFYFHLPVSTLFTTAFINHNFSLPIELHATYFAMYTALSLFIFLLSALQEKLNHKKILYGFCCSILFAGIIQLTSRAVFAAIIIIALLGISIFLFQGKKRIGFLVASILIISITFFIITKVDAFKLRYVSELKNDLTQTAINDEVLEPRVVRWELAWSLIKVSPVIGYGNGSEKELLKQLYFQNKLYISYLEEFNVHSQYLSFLLRAGIIGLTVYIIAVFFGFSIAVQKNDFLFFAFMLLIAIVSLSENILDVNKGIFFYSFFLSFFLIANNTEIFYAGNRKTY